MKLSKIKNKIENKNVLTQSCLWTRHYYHVIMVQKKSRIEPYIIGKSTLKDLSLFICYYQLWLSAIMWCIKINKITSYNKFRAQSARINTSSLINTEKCLNRPITKFYKSDVVNVIGAELQLTKMRPNSFYKKHNLLLYIIIHNTSCLS